MRLIRELLASFITGLLSNFFRGGVQRWKTEAVDRIVAFATHLFSAVLFLVGGTVVLTFFSFAFALWYGQSTGNFALGFVYVAIVWILLIILIYLFRKPIFSDKIEEKLSQQIRLKKRYH